jgi:hypothetical protein
MKEERKRKEEEIKGKRRRKLEGRVNPQIGRSLSAYPADENPRTLPGPPSPLKREGR